MRIALISFEYPPETAFGGIATYTAQQAELLCQAEHDVEVFAASRRSDSELGPTGLRLNRVPVSDLGHREEFTQALGAVFRKRHLHRPFDVVEFPEHGAHGLEIVRDFPHLPRVVRLHTPGYLCEELGWEPLPTSLRWRRWLGALKQGQWPRPSQPPTPNHAEDAERQLTLAADEIVAPCQDLADRAGHDWQLPREQLRVIPNSFTAPDLLLQIPLDTDTRRISFIGRLERRKGIHDLVTAIPLVLRARPDVRFRLIGANALAPDRRSDMHSWIRRHLGRWQEAVELTGAVPPARVHELLAETDICVFPSHWENFPYVCLESMAAGRGIVASDCGGFAELLADPTAGLLVRPRSPQQLAQAIVLMIESPRMRISLARSARERVLRLSGTHLAPLMEASYHRAIARRLERLTLQDVPLDA